MQSFDEKLLQLQQQVALKQQLEAKLTSLQRQRQEFDSKTVALRVAYREEQADVENLECGSLVNYFYRFVGKLDGMLDEERRQAAEAKIKLDTALRELAAIDEEITDVQTRLRALAGCEKAYQAALEEKLSVVKASGSPIGKQILEAEERIVFLQSQQKEIRQACAAGEKAATVARNILSKLSKAGNWNTVDMWLDGGLVSHMAKHSHLDDAQNLVCTLQEHLRKFTTELADIQIQADLQVNIEGFWRFADYFFDGLFVDWRIREQITESQDAVSDVLSKVDSALSKLKKLEANSEKECAVLNAKIEKLILQQ